MRRGRGRAGRFGGGGAARAPKRIRRRRRALRPRDGGAWEFFRRGRGVGRLLVLLGPRCRFVRVARVLTLGNALRIGALEADRGRSFQHEVGDPHVDRGFMSAMNLANSLCSNAQFTEVKVLMNELLPTARRVFGDAHEITIGLRYLLSRSVVDNPDATKQDLRGAKGELEDLLRTTRRVFGTSHPRFEIVQDAIEKANENIETRRANVRLSLGI